MKKAKEVFLVLLWGGVIFPAWFIGFYFFILLVMWALFND